MDSRISDYLSTQAQKALFALHVDTKASLGYIPPKVAFRMFNSYILRILEYNCELWSCSSPTSQIESVHLKYQIMFLVSGPKLRLSQSILWGDW